MWSGSRVSSRCGWAPSPQVRVYIEYSKASLYRVGQLVYLTIVTQHICPLLRCICVLFHISVSACYMYQVSACCICERTHIHRSRGHTCTHVASAHICSKRSLLPTYLRGRSLSACYRKRGVRLQVYASSTPIVTLTCHTASHQAAPTTYTTRMSRLLVYAALNY